MSEIKATCRVCNSSVPANQFKLSHKYKQMVCNNCFIGRTEQKREQIRKVEAPPKPAGWDAEDDYLEKVLKQKKKEEVVKFSRIPGTNQVQCLCKSCKFSFKYDPFRKLPRTCPYCNSDIPKVRTFNLL
jgi:hypothetical protein